MSLAATAERERLARLLRCEPAEVRFLHRFDVGEVRALCLAVAARLLTDHRPTYSRIASASRLLPVRVAAPLAERRLPARVSAGVVGALQPQQAAELASRMSVDYVADVTRHLDPSHAAPVLSRLPVEVVVRVAAVLADRRDFTTMAEVVEALNAEQVQAVAAAIEDPATLVQIALRITATDTLDRLTRVLPEQRLRAMVAWARRRASLWPELVHLLRRLPAAQRRRLLPSTRG